LIFTICTPGLAEQDAPGSVNSHSLRPLVAAFFDGDFLPQT
jgi:hypothetical protein